MLQIDHVYEFFSENIFIDFTLYSLPKGVMEIKDDLTINDIHLFNVNKHQKIFFWDQEPVIPKIVEEYIKIFKFPSGFTLEKAYQLLLDGKVPSHPVVIPYKEHLLNLSDPNRIYKEPHIFVTSEKSFLLTQLQKNYNMKGLYYFFHGFAALDWYRGFYALNYNKSIVKQYDYDFISFNRIINNDRSYRIYFVSLLKEQGLLDHGQVSFNVTDNLFDDWQDEVADPDSKLSTYAKQHIETHLVNIDKLVVDRAELPGSASADIPRGDDAFWNIVTETVFYYDKLHLTEKIFKPIVSKQPFMLLAAPGNLAYLKSYGFKTFDSVIDESYDNIVDNDLRTEAVVRQLHWYCNLSLGEKTDIIKQLEPIIQHNFDHFYGEFRHIITRELLDNTKTLFQEIGYDDSHINYANIHHVLTH